jgi:hypothetical protein
MALTWSGGFVETHLHLNPQFVLTQRIELIRMSRQTLSTNPLHQGDIDAYTVGYRWYPIIFSRGGLAFHNEFSITKTQGMHPPSATRVGPTPFSVGPVWSNSALAGFDFAFYADTSYETKKYTHRNSCASFLRGDSQFCPGEPHRKHTRTGIGG